MYHKGELPEGFEQLQRALDSFAPEYIPLDSWRADADVNGAVVFTWLSDADLKNFMSTIHGSHPTVAVLPHPDGVQSCVGFGVDRKLTGALAHLKESPNPVEVDALYCNDNLVFNHVVIGEAFQLITSKQAKQRSFLFRIRFLLRKLWSIRHFKVKISTGNKELETVVSGIVLVQHGKGSMLSRFILKNTFANDGRFHSFFISPRSHAQLAMFALRSLFKRKALPPFSAHIKAAEMRISSPNGFDFSVDGLSQSAEELHLCIAPKQFRMLPGRNLTIIKEQGGEATDIYKVAALRQKRLPKRFKAASFPSLAMRVRKNSNSFLYSFVAMPN